MRQRGKEREGETKEARRRDRKGEEGSEGETE